MIRSFILALALLGAASAGAAQDRLPLGTARLFSNDYIGDGQDRWRSGSYMVAKLAGPDWTGAPPARFGALLEYRLRGEIVAPASLIDPRADDRRYAGVLAPGVFTHMSLGGFQASVGAELVFTGPQTGVGRFQRTAHRVLGLDRPEVLGDQIPNRVFPTLMAEVGRDLPIGANLTLHPFVAAQAGAESLARVGGDVVLGGFGRSGLLVRDPVTGQRSQGIDGATMPGFSLMAGGDVARVFSSEYLPSDGPADLRDARTRLRLGVNWQGERAAAFYGLTWLGREFDSQPEGQVLGSLRLSLRF